MKVTLKFNVDEGPFLDSLTADLVTAAGHGEGITLVTAGGKYFVELDSVYVNP